MFKLDYIESRDIEPWNIPLCYRKKRLLAARKKSKKIALYVYEMADTSTFRYRCYNVSQLSKDSNSWECVYFFMNELSEIIELLEMIDLLVVCRLLWTYPARNLFEKARSMHIPIVYDIDDMVFDIDKTPLVMDTILPVSDEKKDCQYWFGYVSRIMQLMSMADGFISTNEYLANRIKDKFKKTTCVIPNTVNLEQLRVSIRYAEQKRTEDKPFVIGYFSGSPTHKKDFDIAKEGLIRFLNYHSDAVLRVVGFMDFDSEWNKLVYNNRIEEYNLTDFLSLQYLIAESDVNIVPLLQNDFTNCKSELKFFEAGIVKTPTIASPTYTYKNAIQDGENGLIAENDEWFDKLETLYSSFAFRRLIADKAYLDSIDEYYGNKIVNTIENTMDCLKKLKTY